MKHTVYDIPVLGDEEEGAGPELYDMLKLPEDEANNWFLRIDKKRAKDFVVGLECPSCGIKHPMHTIFQHSLQCIALRQKLQSVPTILTPISPIKPEAVVVTSVVPPKEAVVSTKSGAFFLLLIQL